MRHLTPDLPLHLKVQACHILAAGHPSLGLLDHCPGCCSDCFKLKGADLWCAIVLCGAAVLSDFMCDSLGMYSAVFENVPCMVEFHLAQIAHGGSLPPHACS